MLDTNRLQPPRRFSASQRPPAGQPAAPDTRGCESRFISAEDFDTTGILTGVDLCASSYWWVPELHAAAEHGPATLPSAHATARTVSRTTAAA
jgi:hypothetical protein